MFSAIPLASFVTPATQLFIAQGVATALGNPGGIATAAQIQALSSGALGAAGAAAFTNVIVPTATTTAQGLLALRALQFLPPFQNVPNVAENGRVSDSNVAFTLSAN